MDMIRARLREAACLLCFGAVVGLFAFAVFVWIAESTPQVTP